MTSRGSSLGRVVHGAEPGAIRVDDLDPSTLSLAEALEDLDLGADGDRAAHVHVTPPVAAALRASVDWLFGDRATARPLVWRVEDGALEIACPRIDPRGLRAAGEVLALAGGNLGPAFGAEGERGAWLLRVPVWLPRPCFLMLMQGDLPLALPWHAVLRVRMAPAHDVAAWADRAGAQVLDTLAPLVRTSAERPVVLVGHGLRRGYLLADRLVWRLTATPIEGARSGRASELSHVVETDHGDAYWVVDPAWLLRGLPPVAAPAPLEPGRTVPEVTPVAVPVPLEPEHFVPEATPVATVPMPVVAPALERARPAESAPAPEALPVVEPLPAEAQPIASLGEGDVEPIPAEPRPAAVPRPAAAPPRPAGSVTAPVAGAPVAPLAPRPALPPAPAPMRSTAEAVRPRTPAPAPSSAPRPTAPPIAHAPRPVAPAPAPAAAGAPRPFTPPPTPAAAPNPRSALVAEDSMVARIFLTRLLEQRGFNVMPVATAAEVFHALANPAGWGLVCVDVELPDARGAALLTEVRAALARAGGAGEPVALVRDAEDVSIARAAGVTRTLRKPFEREDVDQLLDVLGLTTQRSRP